MSRPVRVLALAPRKYSGSPGMTPVACLNDVIRWWDGHLANAFALKPDLIVLPEACDRPNSFPMDKRLEYYEYRGDKVRDHFLELAVKYHADIAYSAARQLPDGTYRNSTQLLSRAGKIDGIYDKNYLVPSEYTEAGIGCGTEAPVFTTDFGRVGCLICFDIHYDVCKEYEKSRPEVIAFSSNHHGGLLQQHLCYSTQSYLVASIPVDHGCASIVNPVGKILAESTYRYPNLCYADINLDYKVLHWDENWSKLMRAQRELGPNLHICEPDAHLGLLMITCSGDKFTVDDVMREYELETWDHYYARCVRAHDKGIVEKKPRFDY